uniref:Uncharacterized protein n=1 Tax=Salmonella phage pJS4 TaxID=3141578 RepID=A0AAU7E3Q9_9VIRU
MVKRVTVGLKRQAVTICLSGMTLAAKLFYPFCCTFTNRRLY